MNEAVEVSQQPRREWAEQYAANAGITLNFRHPHLDRFISGIMHRPDGSNDVMYDEKAVEAFYTLHERPEE
jgi:hypothetical protein